jgi:hypothetical protein
MIVQTDYRRVILADIPCENKDLFLRVKMDYDMGGHRYFAGKKPRRGYYLSVIPIVLIDHPATHERIAYTEKTFTPFTGARDCVHVTTRYLDASLMKHAKKFAEPESYQYLVDYVLRKNPQIKLKN